MARLASVPVLHSLARVAADFWYGKYTVEGRYGILHTESLRRDFGRPVYESHERDLESVDDLTGMVATSLVDIRASPRTKSPWGPVNGWDEQSPERAWELLLGGATRTPDYIKARETVYASGTRVVNLEAGAIDPAIPGAFWSEVDVIIRPPGEPQDAGC